jgi:adenylate cyclase
MSAPGPNAPNDLARVRHELRNPINHILGYCDILLEDDDLPPAFRDDLERVRNGGQALLALISHYFDDKTFASRKIDLHELSHELRTPVNHIIGYCELLAEQPDAASNPTLLSDLAKIKGAAQTWLRLMEKRLVPLAQNRST